MQESYKCNLPRLARGNEQCLWGIHIAIGDSLYRINKRVEFGCHRDMSVMVCPKIRHIMACPSSCTGVPTMEVAMTTPWPKRPPSMRTKIPRNSDTQRPQSTTAPSVYHKALKKNSTYGMQPPPVYTYVPPTLYITFQTKPKHIILLLASHQIFIWSTKYLSSGDCLNLLSIISHFKYFFKIFFVEY